MKTKVALSYVIVALAMAGLAGCGSSGSGAAAAAGGDTTATGADVSSLTTLPTTDLSAYDTTESASASVSAPLKSIAKGVPGAQGSGKLCRACCEANMLKKHIFRGSLMAQQMRCVAEAFQTAGLITAGTDAFSIYAVTPPSESTTDHDKICSDIPAERTDEIAACKTGDEGPDGGVLMRLGVFGGTELRVDVCKSKPTPALMAEGTYTMSGTKSTTSVVHIGKFGGGTEKMNLSATINGMTALNADLVPTLSGTGSADATASMDGKFGSGTITFNRTEADKSITVSGAFNGTIKEFSSGVETTFTGKAYAKGGGADNTVAAKFSFTGAPPPMPISKMIPFDIPAANLATFLAMMSNQFGFEVTTSNYRTLFVCPNANFDPSAATQTVKPMVLADSTTKACPTMTHTGIECGTITNGSEDSKYTGKKITQSFTTLDCGAATVKDFFTTVSAFDLSTLSATASTIAFTRNWDCSGTATALDFSTLSATAASTLETYMKKCFAAEERGRGNGGMSDYDCSSKDGANAINDVKNTPPDTTTQGVIEGPYTASSGVCGSSTVPTKLFINTNNKTTGKYCFPDRSGACPEFAVTYPQGQPPAVTGLPVAFTKDGGTVTGISGLSFTGDHTGVTAMSVTWSGEGCSKTYTKDTFTAFTAPTAPTAGKAADFPAECAARGLTTTMACGDYCHSHTCTPPH